ncbi:DsbA family protein [Candidatus Parcubacteria bacterium]|nr:DsbA family protein [Patescibacteria group bacterium]MBU4309535.1 DsbA family protein [Patescibacteria group bacterium]MBU4432356.1 DsbA family protein [Patescibacteria group bacterium]MBU4577241.1 DsbA family protein [Patescibacteria group bacterium]MCG2696887.1 DsbA family protein [Candidatus Parcubacteria bacterium]
MSKKEKFSIPLFVSASILVLVFLFVFYCLASMSLTEKFFNDNFAKDARVDKVYLNNDYKNDDPFMTKNPDLKDMLSGPIISKSDPSLGVVQAPVTLVIFSDFQCGICHKQETVLKQILEKYKDRVRLIWKDYPESKTSSNSFQASLAGRCANEQGKFWEYHDLLFANSSQLNNDKFIELAKGLNLNEGKFDNCLKTLKYQKEVNDNIVEANALDITGVPFLYVNDQEVLGEINIDDLSKMVERELEK